MVAWLLLALTCGGIWLTCDAFRFGTSVDKSRHRHLQNIFKQGMEHLTLAEQDELQQRSRIHLGLFHPGLLPWVFLAITVLLAVASAREFGLSF